MTTDIKQLYFIESDFSISTHEEITGGESGEDRLYYIFADHSQNLSQNSLDPYIFDLGIAQLKTGFNVETKVTADIKNAKSFSTLVIGREGKLEDTIYTANLQNERGQSLLESNVSFPLLGFMKVIAAAAEKSYDATEMRMNTSNAIISFFEDKMKPLFQGDAFFHLLFEKLLLENVDYENFVATVSNIDVKLVQNTPIPAPPSIKH